MLVDLSFFGYRELPESLFTRNNITRLILKAHGLRTVSPQIGQLTNLVQLDLSSRNPETREWHANLDRVPETICSLGHLVHLDLSYNGLTALPYHLHHLRSLQYLNISYNQLSDVSNKVFEIATLQLYNCRANKLSYLDEGVGNLQALAELDVGSNMIEEIPETIGRCKMLSVLILDSLWLRSLPDSVGSLESLTILEMSGNQRLTNLPGCLGKLSYLSAVYLHGCDQLPSSQLTSIQKIAIRNRSSDLCSKNTNGPRQHNFDIAVERRIENRDVVPSD